MSKCEIQIEFDRPDRTFFGGETISGKVTVVVNKNVTCQGLVVEGRWKTHGRGNRDSGEYGKTVVGQGDWRAGDTQIFNFEIIAPHSPLTYRGELINLDHCIRVRVDIPWALDPKRDEEFLLLPNLDSPIPDPATLLDPSTGSAVGSAISLIVAIVFIIVGIPLTLLFGFGLIFIGIGGFIMFSVFRKSIAERKLGVVDVKITNDIVAPGDMVQVLLSMAPRQRCTINSATAKISCSEVAISGSGTNKSTHRHSIHEESIVLNGPQEVQANERIEYSGVLSVPLGDAFSFNTGDNRLTWEIETKIDIPSWPDWVSTHPMILVPKECFHSERLSDKRSSNQSNESHEIVEGILVPDFSPNTPATTPTTKHEIPESESPPVDGEPVSQPRDALSAEIVPEAGQPILYQLIDELINADRYSSARDQIIDQHKGETFDVSIVIDRVSSTYGRFDDDRFESGRTLSGTLEGTERKVQIQLPQAANSEVSSLRSGVVWQGNGAITGWDSLYDRLEMQGS